MAYEPVGVQLEAKDAAAYFSALDKVESAHQALTKSTRALVDVLNAFDGKAASAARAADLLRGAVDKAETKAWDWGKATDAAADDAADLGKAAGGARDDVERLGGATGEAGQGARHLGDSAQVGAKGLDILGEAAIGAVRRVGELTVEAVQEAGEALFEFGKESVSLAGDFEGGMNRFQAAVGDIDASGLEDFRDLFLDIGKELPVSTMEVQDAAIALVKGGLNPAILAAGGLKDSIQFAAAAEMDLAEAAELGVKQLGIWTSATASAEQQTAFLAMSQDMLVKAAGASTLNVDSLAKAMNIAGGQAKALNLDYQDFATGLTLISPAFNSAEEAGTAYKNFLARIQPSTAPATEAMQQLGLWTEEAGSAFFNAQGQFVGNAEAARLLQEATAGLTDEQRAQALQTIFGNDAMGAAVALAQSGAEGYEILAGKIDDAAGVQATAAAKQEGYNTALDNAKGSVEALQIMLGSYLLPVLTELLNDYISPGINAIGEFADRIFGAADPVSALVSEIDKLIPGFGGVIEAVSGVVQWFSQASGETSTLSKQAGDLASGALQFLTRAWNDDVLPAIQTVSAFFVSDILPILNDVAQTALPILNSALQVAASFWDNVLVPALRLAWNVISTVVVPILSELAKWLKENLPPAVQTVANFLSNTLFPALSTVYGFINENVVPILSALADVYFAAVGKALEALAGLWQNVLSPALSDLWTYLDQNIGPILEDFAQWLDDATGGIDGISRAIDKAIGWLQELADKIANLELPDWLTPGSPTPLEIGLYGIADALRAVVSEGLTFGANLDDINDVLERTSELISGALSGRADLLTTQANNKEKLAKAQEDFDPRAYGTLQQQLNDALTESQKLTDPEAAARYYNMLSSQAFDYAKLQNEYFEAEAKWDTKKMERLYEQMTLIEEAQRLKREAFKEDQKQQENPLAALHTQIQQILLSLDDAGSPAATALYEQLVELAGLVYGAPGMAQGGNVSAGSLYKVGEKGWEYFIPGADGLIIPHQQAMRGLLMADQRVTPPASPMQMMQSVTNYNYHGQVGNSLNMPVHMNQARDIGPSMQIAQALI